MGWRSSSPDRESARQALTGALDVDSTGTQHARRGLGLFSKKNQNWAIQRHGVQGNYLLYWNDLFHTLLNMPRYRFVAVFFGVYTLQYIVFAILYLAQSDECIKGVHLFSHAMWFSVQTASTIGYGNIVPDINCTMPNLLVMVQVICSALIDYSMLGIVFARFAAPHKRCQTIRFSGAAVVHCAEEDGTWRLVLRVANIRKHPILKPKIQLLLATPEPSAPGTFSFQELPILAPKEQQAALKLGLPVTLTHPITPASPLWGVSLEGLAARDVEVLAFLDGTDAMTSNALQARYAYGMGDVRLNEQFAPMHLTSSRGKVGLDFSGFDITLPCRSPLSEGFLNGTPGSLPTSHPASVQASPRLPTSHPASPLALSHQAPSYPPSPRPLRAVSPHVLRCTSFQELSQHSRRGRTFAAASEQDRATQMQALVAAVLADPVCSDSLKRLATVVQCAHPDHQ